MISSILSRTGALSAVPTALARMNGAMFLWRTTLERAPAPVAPSPCDVVAVEGAARLLRYRPLEGVAQTGTAVLLCPSLINRLYVLDLKSGISVVEALLQAGHRVYGVDWGEPGAAEHGVDFAGFTERLARFLDTTAIDARLDKVHVLGHCLGGTLATALAAVDDRRFASLINLTAPLAFHDDGLLSKWTRAPFFQPELVVKALGHVPPWLTQPAFQVLKPMGQPSKALRLFQNLDKPQFLEMFRCLETWINDNVSIPDAFFVDLVRTLYGDDGLVNGRVVLRDKLVRLEDVKVPVLTVAAADDHIVPLSSAIDVAARFGGAAPSPHNRVEVLPGGHIGVVVGGLARRRLWPLLLEWLARDAAAPSPSKARKQHGGEA